MGNSKLSAGCQFHVPGSNQPAGPSSNGILARVRGDYISEALQTLPRPDWNTSPQHHEVVINAGHAGWVRLYIQLGRYKHGKSSYYHWKAYRAEPVDGGE